VKGKLCSNEIFGFLWDDLRPGKCCIDREEQERAHTKHMNEFSPRDTPLISYFDLLIR
jgi:hypothetical protein